MPNANDLDPSEALVWQPAPKEEEKDDEEMAQTATSEEFEQYLSEVVDFRGEKMPRRQMLEIQKKEKQGE